MPSWRAVPSYRASQPDRGVANFMSSAADLERRAAAAAAAAALTAQLWVPDGIASSAKHQHIA